MGRETQDYQFERINNGSKKSSMSWVLVCGVMKWSIWLEKHIEMDDRIYIICKDLYIKILFSWYWEDHEHS